MPSLIKYMGYEDDGVDGFLCLSCKSKISIRMSNCQPIEFCPYCGTEFKGGFIKDNRRLRRRYNNNPNIFNTHWKLEFYEKNYHGNGEPFRGEKWEAIYGRYTRKELLELQKQKIDEYIKQHNSKTFTFADKVEFKTRLVYVRKYPDKEVIVKVINETNNVVLDHSFKKTKKSR